ncbi:DUF6959 family protein [Roseateles sp. LYH14W]|uniref:DUF6959 family protein n=1 Tax=Pelomonas parva TaxID=3299032 RepID=A0ABW7F150_9BURK
MACSRPTIEIAEYRPHAMREQAVEIYSDATNAAVMRHPERRFPGVLMQGDTLNELVRELNRVQADVQLLNSDVAEDIADIRDNLQSLLDHYETTLSAHGIALPYSKS